MFINLNILVMAAYLFNFWVASQYYLWANNYLSAFFLKPRAISYHWFLNRTPCWNQQSFLAQKWIEMIQYLDYDFCEAGGKRKQKSSIKYLKVVLLFFSPWLLATQLYWFFTTCVFKTANSTTKLSVLWASCLVTCSPEQIFMTTW